MPRSKFVVLVAICLCASTMSLTPDSLVPEVLVETLPYDVAAEATSFIEARKGDNKACIKEANLGLKSVTDSVNAQNTASAGLSDGSTCAVAGKQLIASAQSAADQASKDASQATSALSNAASAPVERKFPFTSSSDSMKDSQCKQLFQSSSWIAAKAAYASAQSEVTKTAERKRLSAEALTQAEADAAESTSKCLCDAQEAHAAFVAEVATSSSGFERLWKVSQKILCVTGETCQDTAVPAFAPQKQLTADAKQAKCGPTAKEKADKEKADKTTFNSVKGYNTQCSEMRHKKLQFLDKQHIGRSCHEGPLTRFEMGLLGTPFNQRTGCTTCTCPKDGNTMLYSYWCATSSNGGWATKTKSITASCEKADNEKLQFLDRQFVDCGKGSAIKDFRFSGVGCDGDKMRYIGHCYTSVTENTKTTHYTKCSDAQDKTLESLDQYNVECPTGSAMRAFGLVKGSCKGNDFQYKIYCAKYEDKNPTPRSDKFKY